MPIHVDDILESCSLRVFWSAMVDEKGFFSIDWMGLPEDDRRLMIGLVRDLKRCFDGWREKWRRKHKDAPSMIVPWVNAAMVYGGAMQRFARLHEIGGHDKLGKMMPDSKSINLYVQLYLLRLPEKPSARELLL
jgi:hypothetical protein